MALIDEFSTKVFDVPGKPGQWVSMRPVRVGDLEKLYLHQAELRFSPALLSDLVVSWSYEDPVTAESIENLGLVDDLDRMAFELSFPDKNRDVANESLRESQAAFRQMILRWLEGDGKDPSI